jgi:methylphosphotriester-DNA--protein-cysteine methyltransferase
MIQSELPQADLMYAALVRRDASFEGVFFTAVRTTGVFCRPTCSARSPARRNVEFFASARDALLAGYRPCKRCHPMENRGDPPSWLRELVRGWKRRTKSVGPIRTCARADWTRRACAVGSSSTTP